MEKNLMIAGFGGQGIMMLGKLLCYATSESTDLNVSFFPSYGPEMRGGTANCYVVLSDEFIGSPLSDEIDDLIVMNNPSLVKFSGKLKSGGNLFVNSSIVKSDIERSDLNVISAPVTEVALELGNAKVVNIIMLGIYIGYTKTISDELMIETISKKLGKKKSLLDLNLEAFARGLAIGKRARTN